MFKQYSMSECGVHNGYTTGCCLAVATRPEAVGISITKPTITSAILLLYNNSTELINLKTPDYYIEKSEWECPGIFQLMGCLLYNQKQMKHSIEPSCCLIIAVFHVLIRRNDKDWKNQTHTGKVWWPCMLRGNINFQQARDREARDGGLLLVPCPPCSVKLPRKYDIFGKKILCKCGYHGVGDIIQQLGSMECFICFWLYKRHPMSWNIPGHSHSDFSI